MIRGSVVPALALVVLACSAAPAAAFPDDGKRWRQVRDTSGVTWNQVAAVCPADGVTR